MRTPTREISKDEIEEVMRARSIVEELLGRRKRIKVDKLVFYYKYEDGEICAYLLRNLPTIAKFVIKHRTPSTRERYFSILLEWMVPISPRAKELIDKLRQLYIEKHHTLSPDGLRIIPISYNALRKKFMNAVRLAGIKKRFFPTLTREPIAYLNAFYPVNFNAVLRYVF